MMDDNCRKVLVKNIPYEVNDDELAKWCSKFGPIAKCSLKRDKFGQSRGFAFVTYRTVEGHDNILSQIPLFLGGRSLYIKTANDQLNFTENQPNPSSDHPSQLPSSFSTNENFNSTTMDNSFMYDDDTHNRLASLRDELEANLECMQIAHEHEIKILREKLSREQKLHREAEESYKEAEEDWKKVNDENNRLRASLIKNVMQTFNIRKDFARRTKEQIKQCRQIEKLCEDMK